jgi:hypothetical protein
MVIFARGMAVSAMDVYRREMAEYRAKLGQ